MTSSHADPHAMRRDGQDEDHRARDQDDGHPGADGRPEEKRQDLTDGDAPVDILLIGHVTRDLVDEHTNPEPHGCLAESPVAPGQDQIEQTGCRTYRQGGTVSFAAVVASQLGRQPTIVTRACSRADVAAMPPNSCVHLLPSPTTTTFANVYTEYGRVQHVFTPAPPIAASDVPAAFHHPSVVLLGPLVNEIGPDVAALFDQDTLVVAGPQGWMRRWDESGRVYSKPWDNADAILPHLDALILSLEDIDYDTERLTPLFDHLSLVVVTEYRNGSTILQKNDDGRIFETKIAPRPAVERDPTGAGDTFATAFVIRLQETGDPIEAARFANVTASFGVEAPGVEGAPSRQQVLDYMAAHPYAPPPAVEWDRHGALAKAERQ